MKKIKSIPFKKQYVPYALIIGGMDNTAGAGIIADMRVFQQFGYWPLNVVTTLTVQNSVAGVTVVKPVDDEFLVQQFEAVFSEFENIKVVKIGLIPNVGQIKIIADLLEKYLDDSIPIVVDPVLGCKNNYAQTDVTNVVDAYNKKLLKLATFVTPNLPELLLLTERVKSKLNIPKTAHNSENNGQISINLDDLQECCLILNNYSNAKNIFCKFRNLTTTNDVIIESGGILLINNEFYIFEHEFIKGVVFHGAGCNFASVLACHLLNSPNYLAAIKKTCFFIQSAVCSAKNVYKEVATLTISY